jgi:cytochrome c oxidase assembly protein subunit 15
MTTTGVATPAPLVAPLALNATEPASGPASAQLPGRGLRRYAWGVTGYNVAVVLWGSIVRATGSGAGCGEHWPLCGGTVVQHWQTTASVIEFAHRATSGVALVLLVGLLGWTWRATPRRHLARVAVLASAVLTFNEALIGALLVLLGLTADNRSPLRAAYLSLHLANTLLLLAALALTAHFLARTNGRMRGGVEYRGLLPVLTGLGATLVVGVTGSLAALGDTLFPARSLREAIAQDFSGTVAGPGSWLLRVRWVHPAMSVVAAAFVCVILAAALRSARHRALGQLVIGLLVLQMVLGVADVLLLAPTWLQITHLLGADLLWISLVVLSARLCVVPIGCPEGAAGCRLAQG